jgi:tRNA threonylcarbamoyladenosine biosynthesis protein TsaE
MRQWTVTTSSPDATRELGRALGECLTAPVVLFLQGELGAGKTCFTQGLANGLGVAADEAVTSPSYTLMNHYRGRLDLYHFDLYRLSEPDDLIELGFDDYLDGGGVTVVEWADRFPDLGGGALCLEFASPGPEERCITFSAEAGEGELLLARLIERWAERMRNHD